MKARILISLLICFIFCCSLSVAEESTINIGYWDVRSETVQNFLKQNQDTNLIHAMRYSHYLVGQKWATPELKVPIQSNALIAGTNYGVAARGNTKHYEYDGITNVTLGIHFTGN